MPRITKKSLTKALDDKGFILSPCIAKCEAGDMRLYKKYGHTYYATINFVGGKLRFNGQEYDSVDAMLGAIDKYNGTLEFNPDTYNPDYTAEAVTDMRLHATIRKCGYKGSGYDGYAADGVLGFKFPSIHGNALILGDSRFTELYDKDDSDQVKSKKIMSLLGALYAANISILASKLADMGSLDTLSSIKIKTLSLDTFEITEHDGIDGVISILETALSRMKKAKEAKEK